MIVVMSPQATHEQTELASALLRENGLTPVPAKAAGATLLVSEGTGSPELSASVERSAGVERVVVVPGAQRLTSRTYHPEDTRVTAGGPDGSTLGGPGFLVVAGPCAVETPQQMSTVVDVVAEAGAGMLRGGAFKPRTSPYSFQGLGVSGLALLAEQRMRTGLPVVTEVVAPADVERVAEESDMLQIGTRNMQNFALLREAGASGRPVLLKRGMAATIEEWLLAAEYLMQMGNGDVVLCERGIRSFERSTRFTLDLSAVAEAKRLTHLPVIVDPSHSTGQPHLVGPMSLAAAACGADGLLIDVHTNARGALCDGAQALDAPQFTELMDRLRPVVEAVGRTLARPRSRSLAQV
ncbi:MULTISPECIES: 3-deoxy-7-phosphoheptulonate synthase [unclassified Streptomyces]|uniref:3-deoxy-7-phosphoheptulonate synthase n=1 Tax=unclassified Streptomyces TaxID=2593676 RepID=UPI00037CEE29|nr:MULTISPECIES: 3-deoxy-7-phosphoheptulonate synthase [unclassified Streptomyces]MYY05515.1 3-deoxy-7-phosphoheptulonate synthase [Streptomyces sp. SID4913]